MDEPGLIAVFTLAFGLGILHALDADHVMAVSGLCSARNGWRNSLGFCFQWAIGHGTTLLLIGSVVIYFGLSIPDELSHVAENIVAIVLICIGVFVIWDLFRNRAHLHFHGHDSLPRHAHWHTHTGKGNLEDHTNSRQMDECHQKTPHSHNHSAVMVGVLHGAAGSAPLLALIPLSRMNSPLLGLLYLAIFSLGVIVSMLVFGGMLGGVYTWLARWGGNAVRLVRVLVGFSAIFFGSYLLYGSI